jgi:uncharacterized protein YndB with AHSA1/START domain
MDEVTTLAPIRRTITVRCALDRAFRVFTEDIGKWWPLGTHSVAEYTYGGRVKATTAVLEGRTGGRVYEVMADGRECHWAEVLEWEPPTRLVLAWKPNPDRPSPTEVEITFTDVGDGQTRVDVEHRGWERLGEDAAEAREGYAGYQAWPGVLELFAKYVEG